MSITLQSKYTPTTLDEISLDEKILDPIISFANSWLQGFPNMSRPSLILYGKPGTGKTLTARALCNDCDWTITELNASSIRTKEQLLGLFKIPSYDFFGRRMCLFLDEIDSSEKGGEQLLKKVIMKMKFPVIMAANDFKKVPKSLRDVSESVQFFRPSVKALREHLLKINREEGLCLPSEVINAAAESQDFRAAFNMLDAKQILTIKEKKPSASEITTNLILKQSISIPETNSDKDKKLRSSLLYYLDENAPRYYDMLDLYELFETLSTVDKYNKRGQTKFSVSEIKEIPMATRDIEDIKYPVYYEKNKNRDAVKVS